MIHSTRPIVSPVANIVFTLFYILDFEKWDGRTDDMCENNDPLQAVTVGWPIGSIFLRFSLFLALSYVIALSGDLSLN